MQTASAYINAQKGLTHALHLFFFCEYTCTPCQLLNELHPWVYIQPHTHIQYISTVGYTLCACNACGHKDMWKSLILFFLLPPSQIVSHSKIFEESKYQFDHLFSAWLQKKKRELMPDQLMPDQIGTWTKHAFFLWESPNTLLVTIVLAF